MKRFLFFATIIAVSCFCIYNTSKTTNAAEFKQIDFHNYPVTEDRYDNIKIPQPKHIYTSVTTSNNTATSSSSKITSKNNNKSTKTTKAANTNNTTKTSTKKTNSKTKTLGMPIPSWVYENTTTSDKYYDVITNNSIFFSTADCPAGKTKVDNIKKAASSTGISAKYRDKTELMPTGSSTVMTCSKTYKNGICAADKSTPAHYCKCAAHYLLDSCRSNVCIINAKEKRMLKVRTDEEVLKAKFKEVKELW